MAQAARKSVHERYAAPVSAPLRSLVPLALIGLGLALGGCGDPRATSATTVDGITLDRGVVVGAEGDQAPGVRALNATQPKPLGSLQTALRSSQFRDTTSKVTAYLNGVVAAAGAKELAYPGDRAAWLSRDPSDPAATPSGIVGLFPAPFSTRFTAKRRLYPALEQCADLPSAGCKAVSAAFVKNDLRISRSNLQDTALTTAVRVYVGPWTALRGAFKRGRLNAALAIEQPAEQNGYGVQLAGNGSQVIPGAKFGEASDLGEYGAGTGVIFAFSDSLGLPIWVVTGTDDAGVVRAAGALDQDTLSGRVAAVVPAG